MMWRSGSVCLLLYKRQGPRVCASCCTTALEPMLCIPPPFPDISRGACQGHASSTPEAPLMETAAFRTRIETEERARMRKHHVKERRNTGMAGYRCKVCVTCLVTVSGHASISPLLHVLFPHPCPLLCLVPCPEGRRLHRPRFRS